jgi:GAF domain-containing protein
VEKGVCVGTLCLLDTRPRELTTREHQLLRDLGQLVAQELKESSALKLGPRERRSEAVCPEAPDGPTAS